MQASPSVKVEQIATELQGDSASLIDSIERAPFGPITGLTLGNGLQETRTLDQNYRVTNIEVSGVLSLDYGYTVDSNIAGIDDLLDTAASQSFDYDPVDRLTDAQGLFGLLEYDYDASGNRTALTRDGQTEDYRIHYGNNQLLDAGPVDNTYDDNGNLTDRGGDLFTYDTQNRLVGASVNGNTALYTYNHLDQRVTKTVAGTTTLFLYDRSGNLIAEVDEATGQTLAEYVWLDSSPVAYVENGQRYQVHVDHLGTPKALTDSTGNTAWKAHYSPFGRADITSQGPTFNLRFPGQYFDTETGLHYNWRRYYDPDTGRYITSDPIGLAGGINTYAYALSNPLGNADPTGEFVPLLIGAYAAVEFALSAWDAYDTYQTITSDCTSTGEKWAAGGMFAAGVILPGNYGWVDNAAERALGTHRQLKNAGAIDSHHIIQDAAVKTLPGYSRMDAPAVQLKGPSTARGSEHYIATQVQRQRGGGTYGAERRIAYKALRRAGLPKAEVRGHIGRADEYFMGNLGVDLDTPVRAVRNRR